MVHTESNKKTNPQEVPSESIIIDEQYSLTIDEFQDAQRAMAIALFNLEAQGNEAIQKGQK